MSKQYFKWGNGKHVLIFLHYFGGNAYCWKWVAEELGNEYTCIAINLPGFGNSSSTLYPSILNFALNIKLIIKKLGIKKYSLIGHSMGGKIALQLAATDNISIKNILLLAPSPPGIEAIPNEIKLQLLKMPTIEEANKTINNLVLNPLPKFQFNAAVVAQLETSETARKWWVYAGSKQSIIIQLCKIKRPVTVLSSKTDFAITHNTIQNKVMPLLKNSKLIEIENSGHLYPLEIADQIANLLIKICI